MKTVKDLEAEYAVYVGDKVVARFKSNILAQQESLRQVYGPEMPYTGLTETWQGVTKEIKDHVDWNNPTCCATCKIQAEQAVAARRHSSANSTFS